MQLILSCVHRTGAASTEIVDQQRALQEWIASCVKKKERVKKISSRIVSLDGGRAEIAAACTELETLQRANVKAAKERLDVLRRCVPVPLSSCGAVAQILKVVVPQTSRIT